jgi:proline dehydrogenase
VDAEQSYVQRCIESVSEQMQERYNKNRAYVIPTIQNYLKRSLYRGNVEVELAKYKNLKFGAKLVRGAYIVEETRLAKEGNYETPVVGDFDTTTHNYLTNFEKMLQMPEGEIVVATHNQTTIDATINIKKEKQQ